MDGAPDTDGGDGDFDGYGNQVMDGLAARYLCVTFPAMTTPDAVPPLPPADPNADVDDELADVVAGAPADDNVEPDAEAPDDGDTDDGDEATDGDDNDGDDGDDGDTDPA